MAETSHSVCPHDCPSPCALVVTVDGGRVTTVFHSDLIEVTPAPLASDRDGGP